MRSYICPFVHIPNQKLVKQFFYLHQNVPSTFKCGLSQSNMTSTLYKVQTELYKFLSLGFCGQIYWFRNPVCWSCSQHFGKHYRCHLQAEYMVKARTAFIYVSQWKVSVVIRLNPHKPFAIFSKNNNLSYKIHWFIIQTYISLRGI